MPWKRRKADAYWMMPRWRQRLSQVWFGIRMQGSINTYMIDPRKSLGGISLWGTKHIIHRIVGNSYHVIKLYRTPYLTRIMATNLNYIEFGK